MHFDMIAPQTLRSVVNGVEPIRIKPATLLL